MIRKNPPYENYLVLSPEGNLMFRTSEKRAFWYLKRNLAEIAGLDPFTIKLNFQPKGPGNIGDPYYIQEMKNICVACGIKDMLTRHHLVPYCYRKFFPEELKNNASYDIVPLCSSCHNRYESYAQELKTDLSIEYDAPFDYGIAYNKDVAKNKGRAKAVLQHCYQMPLQRLEQLFLQIECYIGRFPTIEDLLNLASDEPYNFENRIIHAKIVMEKVMDLDAFSKKWRKHFMDSMNPQFMPEYWNIDRSIFRSSPQSLFTS